MSSSSGVTPEHPQPPESPLDVLSRAASMVEEEESGSSNISVGGGIGDGEGGEDRQVRLGGGGGGNGSPLSNSASVSPPRVSPTNSQIARAACDRVPSFKERHPKFRKNCTPDYMVAADQASMHAKIGRQNSGGNTTSQPGSASPPPAPNSPPSRLQIAEATPSTENGRPLDLHPRIPSPADVSTGKPEEQEGPLDFSMKKRRSASPPPPPPYRFTPLTAQRVTPRAPEVTVKSPVVVPAVQRPLQPPPPPYPMAAILRPPPPSYESATIKHGFPTPEALRLAALELEERERARKLRLQQEEEEEERRRQRMRKLAAEKAAKAAAAEKERPVKEITIITDSSADPSLDEHFRRSLGAKYQELFKDKEEARVDEEELDETKAQSPSPPATREDTSEPMDVTVDDDEDKVTSSKNPEEEEDLQEDSEGFSVEDHFAKALGDTWLKIKAQQKSDANKSGSSGHKQSSSPPAPAKVTSSGLVAL